MPNDPEAQKSEQTADNLDNVSGVALSPSQENWSTQNITGDIQSGALSNTEASSKENTSDSSQTLRSGTHGAPETIIPAVSDGDVDAKDADEHVDAAKHSADEELNAEQDRLTDDEGGGEGEYGSEISFSEDLEDDGGIARPVRYELSYWPHHLQAAEKLWTPEERANNHDWKELWKLLLKFFCDSPNAFSTWRRHHMMLPDSDDAPLNPPPNCGRLWAYWSLRGLDSAWLISGS